MDGKASSSWKQRLAKFGSVLFDGLGEISHAGFASLRVVFVWAFGGGALAGARAKLRYKVWKYFGIFKIDGRM